VNGFEGELLVLSRRQFGMLAGAALPIARAALAAKIDSKIDGVQLGAQTYSFRDMALDPCIAAMKEIGLGECELFMGHVEPKDLKRDALRQWRLETPASYFEGIAKKFADAGIQIYAYTINFRDDMSDEELDRGFQQTKWLGPDLITTSTTHTCAKRLVPFAEKHKVRVALHGHDAVNNPNEFSRPEDFSEAMAMSPLFLINLDIGHFTAGGYDAVKYIQQNHDKIVCLHIKDRKRDYAVNGKVGQGTGKNMPFGEGDTPIKPVLQLLKKNGWPIPANIEYEYGTKGMDTVAEVRKCFEYMKAALA